MRMSNSPNRRLLDHRLLAQSHYRNSISPSSTYSEEEDRISEHSSNNQANNLLGNTNHSSSNSATGNNQFPFNMNGTNNQNDIQQNLAAQQAANLAAAQLFRKLQNPLNNNSNNSSNNHSALVAAAAAQLSQSNALSNYSAFYNAAAAAINNGTDLPLLGNINNLANSLKNSVNNNSHAALTNALNSNGAQANSSPNGPSPQSPYIATNQYTEITYKGQQVAAFLAANKNPTEYLLCLPQAFELFLKHLVGGLHTVYTKLKRLEVVPIVCNVEQVRILRGRGAIQPGVNRCKLLSTKDFDTLYKDCTTARSGRPARPNEDTSLLANCGDVDDCDASCDERQSRRVLARLGNRLHIQDSLLKRHKTDLDNNMLPLLFANEDSGQGGNEQSSHRSSPNGQNNLLSPAAVALRFANAVRNSPGIGTLHPFNGNSNNLVNSNANATPNANSSNQTNSNQNSTSNQPNNNSVLGSDINATAAYIWLLSQQQQQQNNSNRTSSSSNSLLNGDLISPSNNNHNNNSTTNGSSLLTNNALSALNLTRSLSNLANAGSAANNSTNNSNPNQASTNNEMNCKPNNHQLDESTDEEDDLNDDEMDDSELRSNHSNLSNSIDNHQPNLFNGFKENRTETPTNTDQLNSNNQMNNLLGPALLSNNKENDGTSKKDPKKEQLPFGQLGLSNLINNDDLFRGLNRSNNSDLKNSNTLVLNQNISSIGNNLSTNTDSLESLLHNIENLVSIAVQNARHQQQQLNLHKAELRAELLNVAEKERDFREQLEKQLNEEQRLKITYRKKLKIERQRRRKIELDLQQVQVRIQSDRNSPLTINEKANGRSSSPMKSQQTKATPTNGNGLEDGNSPSYGSPVSTNENLKDNSHEEKECEMNVD